MLRGLGWFGALLSLDGSVDGVIYLQSQQQQQSDLIILDKIIRRTRTRTAAVPAITMRALGQVLSSQWEGSSQCAWGGRSFIIIHSLTNMELK